MQTPLAWVIIGRTKAKGWKFTPTGMAVTEKRRKEAEALQERKAAEQNGEPAEEGQEEEVKSSDDDETEDEEEEVLELMEEEILQGCLTNIPKPPRNCIRLYLASHFTGE